MSRWSYINSTISGKIKGVNCNFLSCGKMTLVLRRRSAAGVLSFCIGVGYVIRIASIPHVYRIPFAEVVPAKADEGLVAFINTILGESTSKGCGFAAQRNLVKLKIGKKEVVLALGKGR